MKKKSTSTVEVNGNMRVNENGQVNENGRKDEHRPVETQGARIPLRQREKRSTFVRANQVCEYPGCGSRYKLEIDHRIPVAFGGTNAPENLRILCHAHHSRETKDAQLGFKLG